jgi:signal transduction histidine kinase
VNSVIPHCRWLCGALLGLAVACGPARPAEARTAAEVQALVERAARHLREVGPEQAFADFTRPDGGFVDGELYVFCNALNGYVLAHGGNPKLVGRNLGAIQDAEGKSPTLDTHRLGMEQGEGWLEYSWPNPLTRRVQRKVVYVLRIDENIVCGSGYFLDQRE